MGAILLLLILGFVLYGAYLVVKEDIILPIKKRVRRKRQEKRYRKMFFL